MRRRPLVAAFGARSMCRAWLTTVLAVVLALGALSGRADAQSTGSITGTVTDAGTGAPLAGVHVNAYNSSGSPAGSSVMTSALGTYTVTGLGTGTHFVRTSNSSGYVDELYSDKPCPDYYCTVTTGTGVSVTDGATTRSVDFDLALGGTIIGTVTDAGTGGPLANVSVQVYDASGATAGSGATTNGSGVYALTGLAAGLHFVRTSNSLGYVDELYNNLPCPGGNCTVTAGKGVTVTSGTTTSAIDFGLAPGGTITGTVTDAATGAPLANVTVHFYDANWSYIGSNTTNASGVYARAGLGTGTHYVRTSNSLGYIDELYNNIPCPDGSCTLATGTGVSVTAGLTNTGIDFGLAAGGAITGTVTDAATAAPLAGVWVFVYNSSSASAGGAATTNASGTYTLLGLATGTHYVKTWNGLGYVDALYDKIPCPGSDCTVTTGTGVSVTAGATTGGIDFGLDVGGTITGTVTDAATGAPLAYLYVYAYDSSGGYQGSTSTNASGVYALTGLTTGSYFLRTSNSLAYSDELYDNIPCPGGNCTVTAGTGVSVAAGATAGGVNFGLARAGTITGTVTDAATGAPLSGVSVRVYNASSTFVGSATTNASGVYTQTGLTAGLHYVVTSNSLGYVDEVYNNLPCPILQTCTVTSGTGLSVAAGATFGGIDFGLARGGTITGTVTDAATAAPLANVSVRVYNSGGSSYTTVTTIASGVFIRAGLGTGTYFVRTSNSLGYADELYDNIPCPGGSCTLTTGTGVSVTAGTTAGGIDIGLLVPPGPPVIIWATPDAIVHGTALSATQLNATANVAGTFVYTPAAGTVLNAGAGQTLSVTFTPTDTANYTTATKTVTINVAQATPVVTWANPVPILFGSALGDAQLNATASVAGTFAYTPASGTVLNAGMGQTLSVTFTPTDAVNYTAATRTVLIDVVVSTGPPMITDVAPGSGAIGSGVTVTGTGFMGTTAITFNGVTAAYAVVSDMQLTTTVPAGTTTGRVRVTTPGGTATSATDFVVTNQRATRTLPGCYVAGYGVTVSIDVGPAPEVLQQALADTPPPGWTIGTISDSGVWDAPASQVNWGPLFDATSRVLTYVVTPPAETTGTVTFAGVVSFDGVEVPLGGTATLARCEQHPADGNSDFRLVIGEVTGYGAAWKKGNTWAVPPLPIPVGYVTRAGYLWRVEETYRRDAGACPLCWVSLTAVPLPVPDGFVSLEDIPTPRSGPWSLESSAFANCSGGPPKPWWRRSDPGELDPGETRTSAVRHTPATYVPTVPLVVSLTVIPDGDVQTWALEESVPSGWRVSAVSADGYWDEKAGVVRWGPFFDEVPQTLRYTLTPPAGASGPQDLRGTASFDGADVAVTGVRTLQRAPITRPGGRRPWHEAPIARLGAGGRLRDCLQSVCQAGPSRRFTSDVVQN